MKEVLVLYYSQTGQLYDILEKITSGISAEPVRVTFQEIRPEEEFPFPWKPEEFYGVFPQTFLQVESKLQPFPEDVMAKKYDLIILGYTVWFLTPSIPVNSFLKSDQAKKLLRDTPVVTVSASRNMWIMAQEKVKEMLAQNKAQLVGNIALTDRNLNHISVITIVHWLMGGKKTRMWGIFPKPGVSDDEINNAARFGAPIQNAVLQNQYDLLQDELLKKGTVKIIPSLIATDKRGNLVFSKWAGFISKREGEKKRKALVFFKYYLIFAIWVIALIVYLLFLVTYIFRIRKIRQEKAYYSSVILKKV